jgi:hypothetical protein
VIEGRFCPLLWSELLVSVEDERVLFFDFEGEDFDNFINESSTGFD